MPWRHFTPRRVPLFVSSPSIFAFLFVAWRFLPLVGLVPYSFSFLYFGFLFVFCFGECTYGGSRVWQEYNMVHIFTHGGISSHTISW